MARAEAVERGTDEQRAAGPQGMQVLQRIALLGILLLAGALHIVGLEKPGLANLYYAATVRSMMTSWHAFFFASFDPAGFVSVDKPPLGFWLQTASALLLGFHGLSLLLPQAFAGILSVALVYRLASMSFGPAAGLLAALFLALTPISVAANRNNTQDSLVVLACLLAAYAVMRSLRTAHLRWLLAAGLLIGLGFEIKMMQVLLVLPAIFGVFLLAAPLAWWKRLMHVAAAGVLLAVVALAWPVAVDATPAAQRPYMGSSTNNTAMELIVGHNGLNRLLPGGWRQVAARVGLRSFLGVQPLPPQPVAGQPGNQPQAPQPILPPLGNQPPVQNAQPGPGLPVAPGNQQRPGNQPPGQNTQPGPGLPVAPGNQQRPGNQPPGQNTPPGNQPQQVGQGIQGEIGAPGALRLFNKQLAGQASWLLPLAALGIVATAWQEKPSVRSRRWQGLALWVLWLLPQVLFFSVANLFHRYYLEMMAPAIAALAGAGIAGMWADYRRHDRWRGWLLPAALVAVAAVQTLLLRPFPEWDGYLAPLVAGGAVFAALLLVAVRLWGRHTLAQPLAGVGMAVGLAALLLAPAAWALMPVATGGNVGLPVAGPEGLANRQQPKAPVVNRLVEYLQHSRVDERFLVATSNANTAAPIIIATAQPAMALGGFSGGDRILTRRDLEAAVAQGVVRFFLFSDQGGAQPDLVRWVEASCTRVADRVWQGSAPGPGAAAPQGLAPAPGSAQPLGAATGPATGGGQRLFDCGALRQANGS